MGAIIKGRDTDLGRDLAIKVLLDEHKAKPEVIQRFVEEAQIGGQLQHPGITPVYELGQFADQHLFFSMKLVKGKTLSALLEEHADPAVDRMKLLATFEHVCQTMAYAHSRGVIHRDLQAANIMVGAFGDVQVMDWGLAKVLPAGGVADEKKASTRHKGETVIQTMRDVGSDTSERFGSAGSDTSNRSTQTGTASSTRRKLGGMAYSASSQQLQGPVAAEQIVGYMDKNGDGKINKDEASEELKPYFEQIDTNKDGVIDVKEAQVMADYVSSQQAVSKGTTPEGE